MKCAFLSFSVFYLIRVPFLHETAIPGSDFPFVSFLIYFLNLSVNVCF
jgi:hypothetical protein